MASKVRVYGKAQNRTALGIAHAYMVMYPQTTLEDLRKAFPNELNPDKGTKENFILATEKGTDANWDGYFRAEDELLTTGNNLRVSVAKMWTKPSLERIVNHAVQYGIEIKLVDSLDSKSKKKGFDLEFLNGFSPDKSDKDNTKLNFITLLFIYIKKLLGIK